MNHKWSFNMIMFSFTYFPIWDIHSFFLVAEKNSLMYVYYNVSVHSSVDEHVGWFYNLSIVNIHALNIFGGPLVKYQE